MDEILEPSNPWQSLQNPEQPRDDEDSVSVPKEIVYPPELENISYRAAEMPEFQEAVKQAQSRGKAIMNVREILLRHFPEISQLPKPQTVYEKVPKAQVSQRTAFTSTFRQALSYDYIIARNIVDLLFK